MKNAGFQARRSILQPPGVAGWLCKYRYAANRGGKEGCCMRKEFCYPELASYAKGEKPAGVVFKHAKVFCVFTGELLEGDLACQDGIVVGLGSYTGEKEIDCTGKVLIPGLIDAHLHMESTLVAPSRLVHAAARFGTTTYIMDPHEAANVAGMDGVSYLLEDTKDAPGNVFAMLPSCVPATAFEDNGCVLRAEDMEPYRDDPRVLGLGEVMDFPSVVSCEPSMMEKLALFQGRVIDGHAPSLTPKELQLYALAGIATDHESTTFADALEKARNGMQVLIREGSAARNLDTIVRGLVESGTELSSFSFCTDDKHIEDICREGHISYCVRRAAALGIPMAKAIQMATLHPARAYGLSHLGRLSPGAQADIVVLDDFDSFSIHSVYYRGKPVGEYPLRPVKPKDALCRTVHLAPLEESAFRLRVGEVSDGIGIVPGEILTRHVRARLPQQDGIFIPDAQWNKIAALERHHATGKIAVGAVTGFGLRGGAIASSVGHDSHNILVVGDNDADMLLAVRELERTGGGYTVVSGGQVRKTLALPILGLMSDLPHEEVDAAVKEMTQMAYRMGVDPGISPFITLSFLALPVIPALRITPRGMFDVETFSFCREVEDGSAG